MIYFFYLFWGRGNCKIFNCLLVFACCQSDLFDNYMQQDAHEFLNYLLNTVADILQEEKKQEKQNGRLKNNGTAVAGAAEAEAENKAEPTWVHDIFQGTLTNETRCLNCETVLFFLLLFLPLRCPPATPALPLLNMRRGNVKERRISLTQRC